MTSPDRFNLDRFVTAQSQVYAQALNELRDGAKRSHWMWFIFPQLRGLGRSSVAERYGITGGEEARAYLDHPVLGPRLECCTLAVLDTKDRSAHEIFGSPDDLKFRSSMTLFASLAPPGSPYHLALERFFVGRPDARTLEML